MPEEEKQKPSKKETPKHPERESVGPEFFTPKMMETEEIKTLLSWEAPSRPFRKKDRSYYTTIIILVVLIVLIVFLWLGDFLLIGVILSFGFVAYVLAFVPPHNIKYKISTQGITIGEDFYFWHFLDAFWFKEKDGSKVLHIQTRLSFPAQLMLVLGNMSEKGVKKVVARFLPFVEVPYKTWMEKWSDGLQKHFPLENVHH